MIRTLRHYFASELPASTRTTGLFAHLLFLSASRKDKMPIMLSLTTHLLKFALVELLANPRVALDLLGVELPLGKKPNLEFAISRSDHLVLGRKRLAIWAGLSTFLWARNSAFMYSSPRSLSSPGRCLRCARRSRRYRCIGGSRATGLGLRPPRVAATASLTVDGRILDQNSSPYWRSWRRGR